jgi:hypothetical protein
MLRDGSSRLGVPLFFCGVLPRRFSRRSMVELTSDQRLAAVVVALRRRTAHSVALRRRGRWFESSRPQPLLGSVSPHIGHTHEQSRRFGPITDQIAERARATDSPGGQPPSSRLGLRLRARHRCRSRERTSVGRRTRRWQSEVCRGTLAATQQRSLVSTVLFRPARTLSRGKKLRAGIAESIESASRSSRLVGGPATQRRLAPPCTPISA